MCVSRCKNPGVILITKSSLCDDLFARLGKSDFLHRVIRRYKEMSHRQSFDNIAHFGGNNPKSTIRQFFNSVACVTCGEQTNKEVCAECVSQPSRAVLVLLEKICQLERTHQQVANVSELQKKSISKRF